MEMQDGLHSNGLPKIYSGLDHTDNTIVFLSSWTGFRIQCRSGWKTKTMFFWG